MSTLSVLTNSTPTTSSEPLRFGKNEPWFRVGTEVPSGRDVLLDTALFGEHCHLLGKTGSHKTLFSVLLLSFLIETTDAAVIYVDYGGDRYAFNRLRIAAEKAGKKFRFLSNLPTHASHNFDPLRAYSPVSHDTADRVTDYLISSLSLDPGEGDKAYWGRVNQSSVLLATTALVDAGITHPTLTDYRDQLAETSKRLRKNDATESLLAFQQLAAVRCLEPAHTPDHEIDYGRVLEDGEVVVLHLPTLLSPTARAIGGLNLFSLAGAAMAREENGLPKKQAFVGVDEFQTVAKDSRAFQDLLTLTRKFGIGLAPMANQTYDQLRGRGTDLRDIVFENTNVRLFLSANDDYVIDKIRSKSKDCIRELTGRSTSTSLDLSVQTRPYIDRQFERNTALDASATRFHGVLVVDDGIQQHEPIRVAFDPGCTPEEHERLRQIPIPKVPTGAAAMLNPSGTMSHPQATTTPSTARPTKTTKPLSDPVRQQRHDTLRAMIKRINAAESYPPPT